jgi:DNA-binding NtrC family response regulator
MTSGSGDRLLSALYLPSPDRDVGAVTGSFARAGVQLTPARDLADLLRLSADRPFDTCLIDLAAGRPALSIAHLVTAERPDLPLAALVDLGQSDMAEDALPAGVTEILAWPAAAGDLQLFVANLRDRAGVDVPLPHLADGEPVVETSPVMALLMDRLRAAPDRTGALFWGEPGSGRRLLARTLHDRGAPCGTRPFIQIDGALPPAELERRLFGVAPDRRRAGAEWVGPESALAAAAGGTLLVTNLTRMPARQQARLARVLRDGEAVGAADRDPVELDVRVMAVAATSLDEQVREGDVRDDLAERLVGFVVEVPPLRRRREDIPKLAAHFLRAAATRRAGLEPEPGRGDGRHAQPRFSRSALALLSALPWPGNAAELRQLIETVAPAVGRAVIQIDDLLERASLDGVATRLDAGITLRDLRTRFEREYISAVLARHHGRVGEAAKTLGIQRTNLYRKVRQLNVARSLLGARR